MPNYFNPFLRQLVLARSGSEIGPNLTPNRKRPKNACLNTIESYFWGVYQRYCYLCFPLSLTLTHNEFEGGFLVLSHCKLREDELSRDLIKLYSA